MSVADFPPAPSILDVIDRPTAERTARRDDPVGILVLSVLNAADPDAMFEHLTRPMIVGFDHMTRKRKVTALAAAFGAERHAMKRYMRGRAICGPRD